MWKPFDSVSKVSAYMSLGQLDTLQFKTYYISYHKNVHIDSLYTYSPR